VDLQDDADVSENMLSQISGAEVKGREIEPLKMEIACFSETSASTDKSTWRQNP
jgi:hypothetical protein